MVAITSVLSAAVAAQSLLTGSSIYRSEPALVLQQRDVKSTPSLTTFRTIVHTESQSSSVEATPPPFSPRLPSRPTTYAGKPHSNSTMRGKHTTTSPLPRPPPMSMEKPSSQTSFAYGKEVKMAISVLSHTTSITASFTTPKHPSVSSSSDHKGKPLYTGSVRQCIEECGPEHKAKNSSRPRQLVPPESLGKNETCIMDCIFRHLGPPLKSTGVHQHASPVTVPATTTSTATHTMTAQITARSDIDDDNNRPVIRKIQEAMEGLCREGCVEDGFCFMNCVVTAVYSATQAASSIASAARATATTTSMAIITSRPNQNDVNDDVELRIVHQEVSNECAHKCTQDDVCYNICYVDGIASVTKSWSTRTTAVAVAPITTPPSATITQRSANAPDDDNARLPECYRKCVTDSHNVTANNLRCIYRCLVAPPHASKHTTTASSALSTPSTTLQQATTIQHSVEATDDFSSKLEKCYNKCVAYSHNSTADDLRCIHECLNTTPRSSKYTTTTSPSPSTSEPTTTPSTSATRLTRRSEPSPTGNSQLERDKLDWHWYREPSHIVELHHPYGYLQTPDPHRQWAARSCAVTCLGVPLRFGGDELEQCFMDCVQAWRDRNPLLVPITASTNTETYNAANEYCGKICLASVLFRGHHSCYYNCMTECNVEPRKGEREPKKPCYPVGIER